jgi:hypothetical protein
MWRRKSGSGAVDAQGNLLIHPMVSSSAYVDIHTPLMYARHGLMKDYSGGVEAPSMEQAHGAVGHTMLVTPGHLTRQMTRTPVITTT